MSKHYEYKGEFYKLRELAKLSKGLSPNLISVRIRQGWSVEKAVETPKFSSSQVRIYECVVDGVKMGVSQLSAHTGLSKDTIYHRLFRGATLQDIADNPQKYGHVLRYMYRGKAYTITEISKMVSYATTTVRHYLYCGYSVEDILNGRCKGGRRGTQGILYEYNGRTLTLREISRLPECKVSLGVLRNRIHRNWPLDKAVLISLYGRRETA